MTKKIVWLVVTCLMAAALLLASCAPGPPTPTSTPTLTPTPTPTPTPTTASTSGTEVPKYGGTLTFIDNAAPAGFDDCYTKYSDCRANKQIYNDMFDGDWAMGLGGTKEVSWFYSAFTGLKEHAGYLVESWELTDPVTLTFHVRKGVHWQDKPPVNGREMTADDIVYSLKRALTIPTSSARANLPWGFEITAPDKWTVVVKSSAPEYTGEFLRDGGSQIYIVPHEMVEKYGDLRQWENSCGTGPFVLVDYVSGSSLTLKRNPNYFLRDALHPENQLPYVDAVKYLVIPDLSTQLAAMRTDKADQIGGYAALSSEDGKSLIKTNPKLKYVENLDPNIFAMAMRLDKPELPFKDVRVRRALSMAIDRKAIVKDYYSGNAEILTFPTAPLPEYSSFYIPVEKLPASGQEAYSYNPEKAKQLLAEAGYPNGFKTEIIIWSKFIDIMSIYKDYWSKIGVDLKLDVREQSVWTAVKATLAHKEMYLMQGVFSAPFKMLYFRPGSAANPSLINDPRTNETYEQVGKNFVNVPERDRIYREWLPYALDQAWYIQLVHPYIYTVWEPWVKSYHGEFSVGYSSHGNWPQFVWIDQDLKQQMTGRR